LARTPFLEGKNPLLVAGLPALESRKYCEKTAPHDKSAKAEDLSRPSNLKGEVKKGQEGENGG